MCFEATARRQKKQEYLIDRTLVHVRCLQEVLQMMSSGLWNMPYEDYLPLYDAASPLPFRWEHAVRKAYLRRPLTLLSRLRSWRRRLRSQESTLFERYIKRNRLR
jgi:hypothetical protein